MPCSSRSRCRSRRSRIASSRSVTAHGATRPTAPPTHSHHARLARPPNTDGGLGCKVPRKDAKQPWDIGGIQSGFYAEWAFSYHVVSHEVACKPLPLDRKYFRNPGPGTVALIRDRHKEAGATCVVDATEGP